MIGRPVSLVEILNASRTAHSNEIHVSIPARIVSYDVVKQTATCEPVCKQPIDTDTGEVGYFEHPTFPEVPIAWPSGGGFFVTFPLSAGDPVLLVFSEVAMGEYLENGEKSEPIDTRRHSLGYPVAIPGGARPNTRAFTDASSSAVIIGKDGSDQQIKIDGSFISLGKGAVDFVALASKVLTELTKIKTAFDAHVHTSGAPGPTTPPTLPMTAPSSVASTIAKAK